MTDISKFKALIKANTTDKPVTTMPISQERQEALNRHKQSQPLPSKGGGTR